jgi:dienelactone hydrolase
MNMHLSPSEVHQHLMKQTTPELQYDGGDVKAWQRKLRRKVRRLVGFDVMPKDRCDLKPRTLWKREHPLGTIEKVAFTSEPHAEVLAYVCLPKDVAPPYTTVVCAQGHNSGMHNAIGVQRGDETKPLEIEGDRDFGIQCMSRGVAALCIEQRAFGERREQKQERQSNGMCQDAAMHALMLGRTLIGERVYDVDRAIDYLATRGDVNMKSIGIMGNSGGGTLSVFSAALLPRLSLAVPGSYFCGFRESIMSIQHCTCNFVPGLYNVADMADILGLFAPNPVVIVNGKEDDIFPIKATRKAFKHLQGIYDACGARDRCHLVVGAEGHRFYAEQAWPLILREIRGTSAPAS